MVVMEAMATLVVVASSVTAAAAVAVVAVLAVAAVVAVVVAVAAAVAVVEVALGMVAVEPWSVSTSPVTPTSSPHPHGLPSPPHSRSNKQALHPLIL